MSRNHITILIALVLGYLAGCLSMEAFAVTKQTQHSEKKPEITQIKQKTNHRKRLKQTRLSTATSENSTFDTQKIKKNIKKISEEITTKQTSPLQKKINVQNKAETNPFATLLMKPNYFLPYYYTAQPYQSIYRGHTPDNQSIMKKEFKAQISFQFPLWRNIFHQHLDLMAAYSQIFFWQFYAKSQYFRETNYEPEIFLRHNFLKNWVLDTGIVHQSNGRGGSLERSWNRAYFNLQFSGKRWYVSLKPWILIFKKESSDLHNKKITHYLGYGRALFAYKYHHAVLSLMLRNFLCSQFKRKTEQVSLSYPIKGRIRAYVQLFHGYGQSLIEYNHKTTAAGVGITINDWI